MAAAPAFSAATQMIVLGLWQPGAKAPVLTALQYHPGQTPLLTKEWTSDVVPAGVLGSPVLSADGKTVYVTGRDRQLWALNAVDGKPKWSLALIFSRRPRRRSRPAGTWSWVAGRTPGWSGSGRRRPGRGGVAPRRRQPADHLQPGRRRRGLHRGGGRPGGLSLLVFNPADGHTLNSYPLPEADGFPVGVSVGNDRRVVAATSAGQVYSLAPAQS